MGTLLISLTTKTKSQRNYLEEKGFQTNCLELAESHLQIVCGREKK